MRFLIYSNNKENSKLRTADKAVAILDSHPQIHRLRRGAGQHQVSAQDELQTQILMTSLLPVMTTVVVMTSFLVYVTTVTGFISVLLCDL